MTETNGKERKKHLAKMSKPSKQKNKKKPKKKIKIKKRKNFVN